MSLARLSALGITPQSLSHPPTSHHNLRTTLSALPSLPSEPFSLAKQIVYRPRGKAKPAANAAATGEKATPSAVLVIAREETELGPAVSGALAKRIGVKEMRVAGEDVVKDLFGETVTFLSLTPTTLPKIITILDSSIFPHSSSSSSSSQLPTLLATPLAPSTTLLLRGPEIAAYLNDLGGAEAFLEVDFAELKAEAVKEGAAKESGKEGAAKEAAASTPAAKDDAKIEGAVQIAIGVKKEVDFATWYTSVLLKADMLDYYNVSGCYILKPWSYSIWEIIQEWFNKEIKLLGVQNAYFPMFISAKSLEREKDHIEGFSPEVAWVTRAGNSDLEEPIAIRPTSETVMYPYYAKWIKSHRDLPLKLNQWNSVVRWEFKNPQPFLRTREFLWQEGHTAHLTKSSADAEVTTILSLYQRIFEDLLAVPVIPGVKSDKEKFAGADYTTTVEGFIPASGRGIQAATSHGLGQNFSRAEMFNIFVEDPIDTTSKAGEKRKVYVWQNSWGLSTRTLGVMVMVHGDNQGLVLPPRVASVQVVIVPCGITARTGEEERKRINDACEELAGRLGAVGVRAKADLREGYTPGWKFNDWEQKGVPIRLEIGPLDLSKSQTLTVRRDTFAKAPHALSTITTTIPALLDTIHADMYNKAKREYDERLRVVRVWEDVGRVLEEKGVCVLPWCERTECEDEIKERSARGSEPTDERAPSAGAKSLCIPFDQSPWPAIEPGITKCPNCGEDGKRWTLFGRSY